MYLPELSAANTTQNYIEEFRGYNHNIRCNDNEFYDMGNLSSSSYPVLSTRPKRGIKKQLSAPNGIICKKGLTYIDGTDLYVNEEKISMPDVILTDCEKQLITMGAYLIILPDKVWVNVESIGTDKFEYGYIEQENRVECATNNVNYEICTSEGETYSDVVSGKEPVNPADGTIWLDTSSSASYLKKWNSIDSMWVTIPTTYIKISGKNIGKNISKGDAVDISGCLYVRNDEDPEVKVKGVAYVKEKPQKGETCYLYSDKACTQKIVEDEANFPTSSKPVWYVYIADGDLYVFQREESPDEYALFRRAIDTSALWGNDFPKEIEALNTSMLVQKATDNYIIVTGIISKVYTQKYGTVKISRAMPVMDYVIENNNRLWGCRYGLNKDGKMVNEIYASKQGDFKNWTCYAGISTDSYAVTVGSDGEFTGAVSYGSYPYFFKENYIHRVAGAIPSQFQMVTTKCRGVQKGSEKSIAEVDEVLFYKSASDICVFQGGLPSSISNALGNVNYKNAVGGAVGSKYYVSMLNTETQKYDLFVYDLSTQLWHKEDNTRSLGFARVDTNLYYIDGDTKQIISPTGDGQREDNIKWYAQTGIIGYSLIGNKYVGRMDIRVMMDITSSIRISIQYDSGVWEYIGTVKGHKTRSFNIPVKPRRCDHFSLRFEGDGECKIFSIAKTIEQGSVY